MKNVLKNVLVTGADTPVGERLIRRLLMDSRVDEILAVTSGKDPLPIEASDRLHCIQVDLRRSRRVHSLLFGPARDLKVNAVIHTAMEQSAAREGSSVHAFNVEALRSIIELSDGSLSPQEAYDEAEAGTFRVFFAQDAAKKTRQKKTSTNAGGDGAKAKK